MTSHEPKPGRDLMLSIGYEALGFGRGDTVRCLEGIEFRGIPAVGKYGQGEDGEEDPHLSS